MRLGSKLSEYLKFALWDIFAIYWNWSGRSVGVGLRRSVGAIQRQHKQVYKHHNTNTGHSVILSSCEAAWQLCHVSLGPDRVYMTYLVLKLWKWISFWKYSSIACHETGTGIPGGPAERLWPPPPRSPAHCDRFCVAFQPVASTSDRYCSDPSLVGFPPPCVQK